jgi:hypothetical protein
MGKKPDKYERLLIVNQLIEYIAVVTMHRTLQTYEGEPSRMILKKRRVYFVDSYTGKSVYAYEGSNRKGFSHGGTMWGLVLDFSLFVREGGDTDGVHGYGGLYCTHWGEPPEVMEKIREYARKIGYLQEGS